MKCKMVVTVSASCSAFLHPICCGRKLVSVGSSHSFVLCPLVLSDVWPVGASADGHRGEKDEGVVLLHLDCLYKVASG